MKLYVKILFACVLSFLAAVSCVKDSADVVSHPDAIVFGIQSLDSVVTRTSYSGDGIYDSSNQLVRERIDWVDDDMISVVCSQAQTVNGTHAADYSVGGVSTSTSDNGLSNATLTPVGSGLQWGSGEHTFYAMYPSVNTPNLYNNTEKGKIGISLTEFKGTIPELQTPQWNNGGKPDMKYAYMFATAPAQAKSGVVDLPFFPQFTAFEFTVTSGEYASVSLRSFTFEALSDNAAVTGDFVLQNTNPGGTPSTSNVSRRITVDLTGRTVTPSAPLKFTVLALPTEIGAMRMTFEGSEIGTRTLVLKDSNDTEITFTARKKYRIGGITFPKDLSGLGKDILWDNEYILEGTLPEVIKTLWRGGTVAFATDLRSYMEEDDGSIYPEPFIFQYSSTGADGSWVDGLPDWIIADPAITRATDLNLTILPQTPLDPTRSVYVRLLQPATGKSLSCEIRQVAPGKFSVSNDKRVCFAPGNLVVEYTNVNGQNHREWKIADQQYSLFDGNPTQTVPVVPAGTTVCLDHFRWATAGVRNPSSTGEGYGVDPGHTEYQPNSCGYMDVYWVPGPTHNLNQTAVSNDSHSLYNMYGLGPSSNLVGWSVYCIPFRGFNYDYDYFTTEAEDTWLNEEDVMRYCDWGVHFDVTGKGYDTPPAAWGGWHTLSVSEWKYVIRDRPGAADKYGSAWIYDDEKGRYIDGIVLLPDEFVLPSDCTFRGDYIAGFYYIGDPSKGVDGPWRDMEANGAVFLPKGGHAFVGSTGVYNRGNWNYEVGDLQGWYWSSSAANGAANEMSITPDELDEYTDTDNIIGSGCALVIRVDQPDWQLVSKEPRSDFHNVRLVVEVQ